MAHITPEEGIFPLFNACFKLCEKVDVLNTGVSYLTLAFLSFYIILSSRSCTMTAIAETSTKHRKRKGQPSFQHLPAERGDSQPR